MATFSSKDVAFLLVGGRSILGSRTSLEVETESPVKPKTPLGVSAVERAFTGLETGKLTQKGYFDETTGAANEALFGTTGRAAQVVSLGLCGNTVGAEAIVFSGQLVGKYTRGQAVEDFHRADAELVSTGQIDDRNNLILLAHAAQTGTTVTGTAVDNAASSSTGLAATLQVSALTLGGYTNAVVKVQHSADNNTWSDLVTFTVVTAAPTAERKTVATGVTINRYLRVTIAYTGSGTGQSITAQVSAERY